MLFRAFLAAAIVVSLGGCERPQQRERRLAIESAEHLVREEMGVDVQLQEPVYVKFKGRDLVCAYAVRKGAPTQDSVPVVVSDGHFASSEGMAYFVARVRHSQCGVAWDKALRESRLSADVPAPP